MNLDDLKAFGNLLCRQAFLLNLTADCIADLVKADPICVRKWQYGEFFPAPEKLPLIALAYKLDFDLVLNTWLISKNARSGEKKVRRPPQIRMEIPPDCDIFLAEGNRGRTSGKHRKS